MLGWQLLDADRCQIYSFNFIYHFDINKNKPRFKILTDKKEQLLKELSDSNEVNMELIERNEDLVDLIKQLDEKLNL